MRANQGMTLIEALIGNLLVAVVIFGSLFLFKEVVRTQANSESALSLAVTRNRLISHLLDARTWEATVAAAENSAFSCLQKQDEVSIANRDCAGVANAKINLYSIDNQKVFELKNSQIGINNTGGLCTSFQALPAAGDPNCPLGISLDAEAQCDSSLPNCLNPPFLFKVQFFYNGGPDKLPLNMAPFNFNFYGVGLYCPPQAPNVGWVGNGSITANPSQVFGITLASQVGQFANTTPYILPCRRVTLDFAIVSGNYDHSHANNSTRVCIVDAADGTCGYSFVHKLMPDGSYSYDLLEGAAVVATKPSWVNLNGDENFDFEVTNGLVKFCLNSQCLHLFEKKLEGPFLLRAYPGWVTTPGLVNIDGFSVTAEDL